MKKLLPLLLLLAGPAFAAVPSTTSISGPYTCNGATVAFPVGFPFLENAHLRVAKTLVASGAETVLATGTEYLVTGAGGASGTVTLTAGSKCAAGYTLTIRRIVPLTQPISLPAAGPYSARVHERALDRLTQIAQQTIRDQAVRDAAQDAALAVGAVGGSDTFVTATGTSTSRPIKDWMAELGTLTSHGAVGDGATLTNAAFVEAMAALPLNVGDAGVLSPKGFANGGTIHIPRGRYKVTSCPIVLKRGTRIVGEGRESTQVVSFCAGSVFQYTDAGRYTSDEVAFEDLSIWQDASVTATSGAGIEVAVDNGIPSHAVSLYVRNVYVEGTYRGITLNTGLSASIRDTVVSKTVSDGFYLQHNTGVTTPASSVGVEFAATYAVLAGGHGYNLEWCSYCSLAATAADANTGDGYHFEGGSTVNLVGGAEGNTGSCVYAHDSQALNLTPFCRQDSGTPVTRNGITLDHSYAVNLFGGQLSAMNSATGTPILITTPGGRVSVFGTYFLNNYAALPHTNDTSQYAEWGPGLLTDGTRWTFGVSNSLSTTAQFAVIGNAVSGVEAGGQFAVTFTTAGAARNDALLVQAATANAAVTYPVVSGVRVPNASKGAASTITRSNGIAILEQTSGTQNVNLALGVESAPAGNWNLYSASTRDSVFVGPLRFSSSTGPTLSYGTGSPESAVTAVVGSIFLRTDGGAGTTLYVKQTGSGNTGWAAK